MMLYTYKRFRVVLLVCLSMMFSAYIRTEMRIVPLTYSMLPALHSMFTDVWNEIFDYHYSMAEYEYVGLFYETNQFESKYISFLVLLDDAEAVGACGIKPFNDTICELKRMWLRKPYRSKGWGSKMLQQLFIDATARKFEYIRLEVHMPERQIQAVQFYRKFGFYEIEPYNHSEPGILCMEKQLQ